MEDSSGVDNCVPLRFTTCTLNGFPNKKYNKILMEFLKEYCEGFFKEETRGGSIVLLGAIGVGKTGLATAIMQEIGLEIVTKPPNYRRPLFITVPDLLDEIRKSYDDPNRQDFFDNIKKCPLLILDDLGIEKRSEWTLEKIFQIINYRYNELLPTIITSNLDMDGMENAFGERVISRLLGMAKVFEVYGQDLRKIEGGENGSIDTTAVNKDVCA